MRHLGFIYWCLTCADALLTLYLFLNSMATEASPLWGFVLARRPELFLPFRLLVGLLVGAVLEESFPRIFKGVTIGLGAVVAWNLFWACLAAVI